MSDLPSLISAGFTPGLWRDVPGFEDLTDITYHRGVERQGGREADQPWVRIAFNRPEVRNAFTPATVDQLIAALRHAAEARDVVAVLLAGNGPSPKDGGHAFCSGGDQRFRGPTGYEPGPTSVDDSVRTTPPPDTSTASALETGGGPSSSGQSPLAPNQDQTPKRGGGQARPSADADLGQEGV
ncbi:MAG: enoyl-CoA hydratase/isomerase family protein [Bifidobacteriaceae bacterium]|jgi:naphthoate synthase|nr:enoyl-CoA hydratase/isomerase family protein [Bifidobacteriaceae bacterium]